MSNVIARYGVPSQIICDNGPAFASQLFKDFCFNFGIKLTHSTPYHPICNAMVERSFRTLKAALRAQENPTNWTDNLPLVLLGLRSTVKEDLDVSAAHMVYGTSLHLPGQFVDHASTIDPPTSTYVQNLISYMSQLNVTPPKHHDIPQAYVDYNLKTCSHVFLRIDSPKGALKPRYSGPHKVLQRHDKYFTLALDGKLPNVSIDRLKAAYLPSFSKQIASNKSIAQNTNLFNSIAVDSDRTTVKSGNNSRDNELNELPENNIDVIYQYRDLVQAPTKTRFGRVIQKPRRYLD